MKKTGRRHPKGYSGTEITTRKFRDVLPSVFSTIQSNHEQRHDLILASWPRIVGSKIAKFTKPESFVDGILKVTVNNSTLYSLLNNTEKAKLLFVLRENFSKVEIKDIFFRMG